MTPDEMNELAVRIQADVNAEIAHACESESRWRWQAVADRIATERLSGDWEWLDINEIGGPPRIALLRYLK